ncbi:uncharacterized protein ARMOST_11707 [Armillaria ostoyae]|uniref:Uncharacterized protein n=1 Tax=Armillaria ostoyae TaxID=47428 RepID=A0A284RHV5_ARMOS|nr:uncharacterized protein ARMOST_11707 [Armillaria ostoyae]
MHDLSAKETGKDNPYRIMLHKLAGLSVSKPCKAQAFSLWVKANLATVQKAWDKQLKKNAVPASEQAAKLNTLKSKLFKLESKEIQDEWSATADEEHKEAVKEYSEKIESLVSKDPAEIQRCLENLLNVVQPFIEMIMEATGCLVMCIVGGPQPADRGRLHISFFHASRTLRMVKQNFVQAERVNYWTYLVPMFGNFLKRCFTVDMCRARALVPDTPTIESIGFASDEQGIAHNHVDGPAFNNDSKQDDGSVSPAKSPTAPPAPVTKTSMSNGPVLPSNSLAECPPVAVLTSMSNWPALALKSLTATSGVHVAMSSLPPSQALSIAPSPHLSHAPSLVQGSLSQAPSIRPSPLPSHASSPTQTSPSCVPSVAPSPVQSRVPTPIQPANPSTVSDGDSDQNAMEAGRNEIVRNNNLLKVQEPKPSTLRNSGPLKNTSGKKWTREDDDIEPRPLKKGKKKNRRKMLPVGAVLKSNEASPSPSSMNKDETTHGITESLPCVAPRWAVDGLATLTCELTPPEFSCLVNLWIRYEKKENFRESAMFSTYQCPQAVRDWIARGHSPKFCLQPVPKGVDPVKEFDGKFWAWWSSLQPESHP